MNKEDYVSLEVAKLQKAKVIKNDNNCCLIHARKFIDKENPRVEFKIVTID